MKPKKFCTSVVGFTLLINCSLLAQENEEKKPVNAWHNEFVGNLNLTQASFDNWTQGGENSLAWQLNLKSKLVNDKEKFNWTNTGKYSFGRTKVGDADSRKSVDEIKLESVLTYKIGSTVNPYFAVSGETQSTTGYRYTKDSKVAVSDFLDPGYFKQSAGFGYVPFDEFKTRFGFALKETITKNHPFPYADDPSTPEIEKTKTETGLESVTDFSQKLGENILLTSTLNLFSNLKTLDETDVKWENILSAKVSKYVVVNLDVNLFYDRDLSKKRQVKESLSLGLTYSLL